MFQYVKQRKTNPDYWVKAKVFVESALICGIHGYQQCLIVIFFFILIPF
tara:strand:- start:947 stop:1093 length:147 start_codon:yes stop_codon:yes gene_type:complete